MVDNEAGSNERKRMRKEVVDGESERARGRDRKRKRGNLHFAKPQSQFIQTAVKRTAEQWDKKTALMVLWLASYAFNNLYYVGMFAGGLSSSLTHWWNNHTQTRYPSYH